MAIQGVFTDLYRAKLADLAADDLVGAAADMLLVNFAVGEGGFDEVPPASGNRFPKTPTGTETDLEADGIGTFRFEKAIGASNISDDGAGTLTVTCVLDSTEAGLDGQGLLQGTDPRLFELGLFDNDSDMMVYLTFDETIKTAGKQIEIELTITY